MTVYLIDFDGTIAEERDGENTHNKINNLLANDPLLEDDQERLEKICKKIFKKAKPLGGQKAWQKFLTKALERKDTVIIISFNQYGVEYFPYYLEKVIKLSKQSAGQMLVVSWTPDDPATANKNAHIKAALTKIKYSLNRHGQIVFVDDRTRNINGIKGIPIKDVEGNQTMVHTILADNKGTHVNTLQQWVDKNIPEMSYDQPVVRSSSCQSSSYSTKMDKPLYTQDLTYHSGYIHPNATATIPSYPLTSVASLPASSTNFKALPMGAYSPAQSTQGSHSQHVTQARPVQSTLSPLYQQNEFPVTSHVNNSIHYAQLQPSSMPPRVQQNTPPVMHHMSSIHSYSPSATTSYSHSAGSYEAVNPYQSHTYSSSQTIAPSLPAQQDNFSNNSYGEFPTTSYVGTTHPLSTTSYSHAIRHHETAYQPRHNPYAPVFATPNGRSTYSASQLPSINNLLNTREEEERIMRSQFPAPGY